LQKVTPNLAWLPLRRKSQVTWKEHGYACVL
jgi:hypothetical protein